MDVLIIIIGASLLQYILKVIRNTSYYAIFLHKELPIIWAILWPILGFFIIYASTFYQKELIGLQIALLGSVVFLIGSFIKKMPVVKPENDTIVQRSLQLHGYLDNSIPYAKLYYRLGLVGFAVAEVATWIANYATSTV
jgi:hypothetical protein